MQQEKWEQLVGRIKDEFAVEEQQTQDGVMAGEKIETIVFVNPAGKMKLQRVVKPRFLGEKTKYAGRLGSQVSIEKVYSEDELVDTVKLFRDSGGEWEEMNVAALG